MKKRLFYISLVIGLALLFLFSKGNNINILAYSDIGNALGSYPVKLDVDNYNRENLINYNNFNFSYTNFYATTSQYVNNDIKTISATNTSNNLFGVNRFNFYGDFEFKEDTFYTFSFDRTAPSNGNFYVIGFEQYNISECPSTINSTGYNRVYYTFNSNCILNPDYTFQKSLTIYLNKNSNTSQNVFYLFNFMLYEGSERLPYSKPFIFGYNVNYSLAVNNLTSSQVNAEIAITDANGNYLKTGNCVIPASSSTICSNINNPLYLPFNIDNNGYISFDYSLGLFISPVGNLNVTPRDSGFNFVPVFSAYYKGEPTENLYFKDRYTFNNLFLSGFNVSVNSSTLSEVSFLRNQVDSEFSMNTNKIINFATDKKIQTGIYNYINYVNFIDSSPSDIYSFVITTGVSNPVILQDRIFTISFSNFSLKVNGDSGNISPLPNNPNTFNKYNECSAWYDIPCQLGNAVTYVIYEAPIISPIINFFDGLIEPIKQFIRLIDQFSGFGILFGLGITAMLICIIKKMYGGSDG